MRGASKAENARGEDCSIDPRVSGFSFLLAITRSYQYRPPLCHSADGAEQERESATYRLLPARKDLFAPLGTGPVRVLLLEFFGDTL